MSCWTFIVKERQEVVTTLCCHGYCIVCFFVSPGLAAPGHSPSVVMTPSVTSAPTSDPTRVVMSVEEFYYGTYDGDLSLRKPQPLGIKTSTFTCQICSHLAENNLRWDHMHLNTPENTTDLCGYM